MSEINLLISKTERKAIQAENKKNRTLWIAIIIWMVFLIFSFIQVELALNEKNQLEQSINQLRRESDNQKLNQQINFSREKIAIIETIENINQTKKLALEELNQLLSNNGIIQSIQSSINANQEIELLVNLSFGENQDSGMVLDRLKEKTIYQQVSILSSSSINGTRQIQLRITSEIQKSEQVR